MARADRRRAKGTKPHAAVNAKRGSAAAIEDTMFFPRLRRHAKWMFVFLALVFAVGFVGFGVGAGGTGLGDIFRDSGGAGDGTPSASESLKRTQEDPQNAEAWRNLSTAYQTDGKTEAAVAALVTYVELRPKDADALRELGGLYLALGAEQSREVQLAQLQAVYSGATTQFTSGLAIDGRPLVEDPIASALESQAVARVSQLSQEAQSSFALAVGTYQDLAAVRPKDPNVQFELAGIAQQAGDVTSAIAAYERFLELAPEDGNAPLVREQLKQLKQAAGASG